MSDDGGAGFDPSLELPSFPDKDMKDSSPKAASFSGAASTATNASDSKQPSKDSKESKESAEWNGKVRSLLSGGPMRFLLELEFVELLANPYYLKCAFCRNRGKHSR